MTKTKSTKRALLLSGLALVLCISMLVGSTYAWFTDSVTSSGNIIKSGTLDVTMEWKDATANGAQQTYKDASEGAIFNYDKWEPGYVEAKNIKIGNAGTLALKYQLNIVANGEVSELADVIDVYYAEGEYTLTDRKMSELTKLGTLTEILAQISTTASGDLLEGESDTVTLALKMQESAGNKYQDLAIGSEFAVQLLATQLTYENDSFDNQYDVDADYVAKFTSGTHELNTTLLATKPGDTVSATGANTVVNINGGYYDAGSIYNNCAVWAYAGATINIKDGTFIADGDTAEQGSGHHYDLIYAGSSKDTTPSYINIYGGMFSVRNNGWLLNEADGKGEITVYGGTFVNWNPADNVSEGANTNFLAEGYGVLTETQANGDIWYTVVKGAVSTADDLADALENGEDVVLADDIELTQPIVVEGDANVVIDLGGRTIEYKDGSQNKRPITADGSATVTIKNGTINSDYAAIAVFGDGKIYAENVVFNANRGFGMNGSSTTENSVAEFVNCEFHISSGYTAAYISAKGTYTFKDCVLEGGTGVLIRSGNVTLDGCTIIANGYMGKGAVQTAFYANYPVDSETEVLKSGVVYWTDSKQEGSVGDCVTIIDNCDGHEIKSVTIKNCKFDVVNAVKVGGADVPAGYAVRYMNQKPQAVESTVIFENNTDLEGNSIKEGTMGLVYSRYPEISGATLVSEGLYVNADGVYYITNAAGFDGMREKVAGEKAYENDGTWVLYNDIDLNGVNWTPIAGFHGIFDGNDKTISNMNASFLAENEFGGNDFGVICTVKNVTFHKASITGTEGVGVVVSNGVAVTIENVKVTESTVIGTKYVGGIVGVVNKAVSTITGCSVENSTIKAEGEGANGKVGGIVGFLSVGKATGNTVTDCTISGPECVGGIAGRGGSGDGPATIYGNTVSGNNVTGTDTTTVGEQIGDSLNVKDSE